MVKPAGSGTFTSLFLLEGTLVACHDAGAGSRNVVSLLASMSRSDATVFSALSMLESLLYHIEILRKTYMADPAQLARWVAVLESGFHVGLPVGVQEE